MRYLKMGMIHFAILVLFFGCKGSSSTADVTEETEEGDGIDEATSVGYSIPSQLVLVGNATSEEASASLSSFGLMMAAANEAIDDDFSSDKPKEYIYDGTGDYLTLINQIFCALGQTQYTDAAVMDQGTQIVLINTSQCATDYYYQTSGRSSADSYEQWLVDAQTSEDGTATVYFQIQGNSDGMGSLGFWYDNIDGQLNITEGISDENQVGLFELNATGYYDDEVVFNTTLASLPREDGLINLQLLMEYPSDFYSFSSGVNAVLDPLGESGEALVIYTSDFDVPDDGMDAQISDTTLQINYDAGHVRTAYVSDGWNFEECVDRSEKTETFVSYNLYSEASDESLTRLDLMTGMSFKTPDESWGYASPWGVSSGEELTEGMIVQGDDGNDYTITVGDGMLMATFKETLDFSFMVGKEIYGYDYTTFESYIMEWDGSDFIKTKIYECGETGACDYTAVSSTEIVTLEAGNYSYYVNGVGSVDFTVSDEGLAADSEFYVSTFEYLAPTDESLQASGFGFKCFYQCPKGGLVQDDITNSTLYYTDDLVHNYTLGDGFTLVEENDGAVTVASLDMTGSYYEWGFTSGPMVPLDSEIDVAEDVYSSDALFTWQVGTNQYNRYVGLLDSDNNAVVFDSYLSCAYENDEGTFLLQYYDQGQLFGIPYVSETDSETGFTTYASQFRIPDRDDVVCDGQTYKSKAVFIQYQMAVVANSECESLAIEPLVRTSIEFTTPDLPEMVPSAEAPAVIGGIIQ